MLPIGAKLFREKGDNGLVFHLGGHTVELPRTMSVQSFMPTPRKNNPGTVKTRINVHWNVLLDAGTASERRVPVVAKVDVSAPVGADTSDILQAIYHAHQMSSTEDNGGNDDQMTIDLFKSGYLPQG